MSDTVDSRITELMALHKEELARMIAESEQAGTAPVLTGDPSLATAAAVVDNTSVV
jgi:hypothetical protein